MDSEIKLEENFQATYDLKSEETFKSEEMFNSKETFQSRKMFQSFLETKLYKDKIYLDNNIQDNSTYIGYDSNEYFVIIKLGEPYNCHVVCPYNEFMLIPKMIRRNMVIIGRIFFFDYYFKQGYPGDIIWINSSFNSEELIANNIRKVIIEYVIDNDNDHKNNDNDHKNNYEDQYCHHIPQESIENSQPIKSIQYDKSKKIMMLHHGAKHDFYMNFLNDGGYIKDTFNNTVIKKLGMDIIEDNDFRLYNLCTIKYGLFVVINEMEKIQLIPTGLFHTVRNNNIIIKLLIQDDYLYKDTTNQIEFNIPWPMSIDILLKLNILYDEDENFNKRFKLMNIKRTYYKINHQHELEYIYNLNYYKKIGYNIFKSKKELIESERSFF